MHGGAGARKKKKKKKKKGEKAERKIDERRRTKKNKADKSRIDDIHTVSRCAGEDLPRAERRMEPVCRGRQTKPDKWTVEGEFPLPPRGPPETQPDPTSTNTGDKT